MTTGLSFTGRRRRRNTSRAVLVADRVARGLITVGGALTVVQVLTVMIFLLWVALPLFRGAHLTAVANTQRPGASGGSPLHVATDEQQLLGWEFLADGRLAAFALADGSPLFVRELFREGAPTAAAFPVQAGRAAFGFADGAVRLGSAEVATAYVPEDEASGAVRNLVAGAALAVGEAIVQRTREGQLRREELLVEIQAPLVPAGGPAVRLIALGESQAGPVIATLDDGDRLAVHFVRERRNPLTGETTAQTRSATLSYTPRTGAEPAWLLVSGHGDDVYLAWRDGTLQRWSLAAAGAAGPVETVDLTPDGAGLTALRFANGGVSLVAGDDRGRLRVWFGARREEAMAPDGKQLVAARELRGPSAGVTALGFSSRTRLLAAGFADGTVDVLHLTSGRRLARLRLSGGAATAVALAPKDDGLIALADGRVARWRLDARHPEAAPAALFAPVWYEGYPAPAHVWQSSSATDESELKFGLMPLVFGTLKATLYSLLFGVPLALLAAVFTSEFLSPAARARIKPTIELMASLPSVVLGFLAALVIAPVAEQAVPAILVSFVTVPAAFLYGAGLWQLLPHRTGARLARWRPALLALALPAGVGAAAVLGPFAERLLFAGDLKLWLDGQIGGATAGWAPLLLPLCGVATALAIPRGLSRWQRRRYAGWTRTRAAAADLGLLAVGSVAALAATGALAALLGGLGLDPRGPLVGTYMQRNSLVVGFVMGFAIIPIIYTIAEDALASVPEHLRAASLGAGATPWQTAVRIIIPTAMSGLFSAVMIGLGRAVGETMIVLMAAGNTPIMDWNVFDGFRTLSANIAVEMPEAVRDSTHYRILFLSALVLFAMTFLLNTVAEIVRLRFRKRAFEL